MRNISINNEDLELKKGKTYIVIDALYLNTIKEKFSGKKYSLKEIRKFFFPYTDTPFAEYVTQNENFKLSKISKIDCTKVIGEDLSIFSTDTGLVLFINKNILWDFVIGFDYEQLVNSEIELLNFSYLEQIISKYDYMDIAVLTSFQEIEFEFNGSGTYKILD